MKTRLNYWLVENSNDDDKKQKGFKDVILEDLQFCEENVFFVHFCFFLYLNFIDIFSTHSERGIGISCRKILKQTKRL